MNENTVLYGEVKIGDVLFIKTKENKKGENQLVCAVENWSTLFGQIIVKITFENKDVWFGISDRELKRGL